MTKLPFRRIVRNVMATVALVFLALSQTSNLAWSQTGDTASLVGSVRDNSEAVIPRAVVKVRNQATGLEQQTASTETGNFVVTRLAPGTYTLTIGKEGFKTFVQEGISLQVDQRSRIDVTLLVGAVTEKVTVTAEAPQLETSQATLKDVVDSKRMMDLPLDGRNPLQLTLLVPGVQPTSGAGVGQAFTNPNQQFVSSSGGKANAIGYNLDGADNSDNYTNVANVYPNPDALQEFSFQTNSYSVEYGRRLGGVVNAVTRSGTNNFHGSLFEYVRNYDMNATNFFTPGKPDGLKRNQYGGSVGGPIIKDKTFFFLSWQGTKIRQLPATATTLVPTQAMRTGDFSGLRDSHGNVIPIKDPTTGTPYLNNQIPLSTFDPISVKVMGLLPVPTDPTGLVRYQILNTSDDDQGVARIDHQISGANRLSGRFLYDTLRRGNSLLPGTILGASYTPNFHSVNMTLSDSYTFSPNLLGAFSVSYNRLFSGYTNGYPTTLAQLGANVYDMSPNKSMAFAVSSWFGPGDIGAAILTRNNFQYQASLTYVVNRHEIKFGADILRQQMNIPIAAYLSDGYWTFSNLYSGNNLTDFVLGRPSSFTQIAPWANAMRGTGPGFYFQDNFKPTQRLTLNLGLRWEPLVPWVDSRNNEISMWQIGSHSQRVPDLPTNEVVVGDPGVPVAGYNGSIAKFDPRVGFAYRLRDQKTSVRGGYGIFHDYPNSVDGNGAAASTPFAPRVDIANPTSFSSPWTAAVPNPFPISIPPPPSFHFPRPVYVVTYGNNFTNSYVQQWNLTIERQVTPSWLARVSYIGSHGVHVGVQRELDPAVYIPGASTLANVNQRRVYAPNFGQVQSYESAGYSFYNGLALSAEKRFSHSYSVMASYTFSKSTDLASASIYPQTTSLVDPHNDRYDYALSDFDHRHRLVASFLWELPGLAKSARLTRYAIGGWQVNGIVTLMSGTPFSILDGQNRSVNGASSSDRPDIIGNPVLASGRSKAAKIAQYFNTNAFTLNALGTYGTSARNTLRGPGYADADLSVFKNFPIRETTRVQVRADFFNALNRTNLSNPSNSISSSTFGRIVSAGTPRTLQLALRLTF